MNNCIYLNKLYNLKEMYLYIHIYIYITNECVYFYIYISMCTLFYAYFFLKFNQKIHEYII